MHAEGLQVFQVVHQLGCVWMVGLGVPQSTDMLSKLQALT